MIIKSPLSVPVSSKKNFSLNLSYYRNTHFQTLNLAKISYQNIVIKTLIGIKFTNPIRITYSYYPKTKRRTDLDNILSIHQKFFQDVLVKANCIPDDGYNWIVQSVQCFGGVDRDDPRVEIKIEEIT